MRVSQPLNVPLHGGTDNPFAGPHVASTALVQKVKYWAKNGGVVSRQQASACRHPPLAFYKVPREAPRGCQGHTLIHQAFAHIGK